MHQLTPKIAIAATTAGGAIVFAARSVSRRKKTNLKKAAIATSLRAQKIITDEKRPHNKTPKFSTPIQVVGLCGDGFKISSEEAAQKISDNPYAFHYRDDYMNSLRRYISAERLDYKGRHLHKPALKGDIDEGVFKIGAHDTLELLGECCGQPEGSRPLWCPVGQNGTKTEYKTEPKTTLDIIDMPQDHKVPQNKQKRQKEMKPETKTYKITFRYCSPNMVCDVVSEQRTITCSLRKAKRIGKRMYRRNKRKTADHARVHIWLVGEQKYHSEVIDVRTGPRWMPLNDVWS